ncbi:DUF6471 domain-containing protein [Phenylobacterium sp. CCH12-B4]|uniref:DUF6471 domain-containing protein n=1 Tax=unclassified Phenylobacterium TaxID=2640670 RepID=UPI003510319E
MAWASVIYITFASERLRAAAERKLAAIGARDTGANLRNKISRGGFTGAFLI